MTALAQLLRVWKQQHDYNVRIRAQEFPTDVTYWSKQYLLGIVSEVDEVLNELAWKANRKHKPIYRENLARELADVTKYVLSLWDLHDFTAGDMLGYVEAKSTELEQQWAQDFEPDIPYFAPVVITDIDGTLGDYRKAFATWLSQTHATDLPVDARQNLAMEVDLGIPFQHYTEYKTEFEARGGYRLLEAYQDAISTLKDLWQRGVYIIAYTARPARQHTRIWYDTWGWLGENDLHPAIRELHIGAEERIQRGLAFQDRGRKVVLLDDDPTLALRAVNAGLTVFLRSHPYNAGLVHDNLIRVETFDVNQIFAYLEAK